MNSEVEDLQEQEHQFERAVTDSPTDRGSDLQVSRLGHQTLLFRRVLWGMWWAGTALIILSWFNVVSNTVGWIGFAVALASSFISVMVNKHWRIPK
jgi:hypothetical protein